MVAAWPGRDRDAPAPEREFAVEPPPSGRSGLGDAYLAASRAGEQGPGRQPAADPDRALVAADPSLDESPGLLGPGPFDPGRRGVKALAVVAAAVVVIAAGWAWWARPRAEPLDPPAIAATEGASAAPGSTGAGQEAEVVVAVTGKVRRPGLVRLPAGSRVADAVQAAGGSLPGADLTMLNLARKVTDGELIAVGIAAVAEGGGTDPAAATGGKVNINSADLTQLQSLPGIGPVLAQAILDHRTKHGPFGSVADLRQVSGIGDTRYEQLKDLVTV
ncbi:helix-hairpin-helix domain-containing protein [Melissospora conviva]|uniref:helix-hairpin-helix domain-containing protein n=1 Tax=Melissospora conviva TaxID=3388432 RepID=UPI003B7EB71A